MSKSRNIKTKFEIMLFGIFIKCVSKERPTQQKPMCQEILLLNKNPKLVTISSIKSAEVVSLKN